MKPRLLPTLCSLLVLVCPRASWAEDARALRLVPFPKEVRLQEASFSLDRALTLELPASAKPLGQLLIQELKRAGLPEPKVQASATPLRLVRLSVQPGGTEPKPTFRPEAGEEDYALEVRPAEIVCTAPADAGLVYAVQTLRQLVRANRRQNALPCLTIRDWPSLRWRCFQDDMTRGPSPRMEVLKLQADLGSYLKMNLFTYYMESQFAFKKHPLIGPKDGSLTAEELTALVEYGRPLHLDVLGNQQSFGHFGNILRHAQYADLRETGDVLCPVKEGTYQLLDDMYSVVCPLLPCPMFNVCCDETWGLGKGPSKELAEKIGVGGVYVRHIRRIHDILKEKYHKRMMMWGDIILQHPDHLSEIPKDTIMLTWGYGPAASFEHQILPFARSGYEFFVCPGVSSWSRILPDFDCATVNIRNFVRDGAKHGAIGMLNTDWEDDGESLNSPTWHGDAWGAECAWNASTTSPEEFNRRIGAVLLGEPNDRFGQAIMRLSQTHRLSGMNGMSNSRFWENDFTPQRPPATITSLGNRLLAIVQPAIEDLQACRKEATVNADLLDGLIFGARRMELIGQRMLDGLEAAQLYARASELPSKDAAPLLPRIEALVRKNRDAHEALGKQFAQLWLQEAKPYALDWTMRRYAGVVKWYDDLAKRLADARKKTEAGQPLPTPDDIGLRLPEAFPRRATPHAVLQTPLDSAAPWAEPAASHRLGLVVEAGSADRYELPIEVVLAIPPELAAKPVRAFWVLVGGDPKEIPAQLDATKSEGKRRLALLIPGPLAKGSEAKVFLYLGLSRAAAPLAQAVSTKDAPKGMKSIENDRVRLLLGPEGAHVYRWEVKTLGGRDLTMPGETGWAGFSDVHALRATPYQLVCVARGPALVRYECTEPAGQIKTISLFAGVSWMEVTLNDSLAHYWDFDDPKNFAGDGPTPGTYLFSTDTTGPVGKQLQGVGAQVEARAHWGIKFNRERLALGLCTPEAPALHKVAPGAGAGGVGIEGSLHASHFVTYAGPLEAEPAETMNRLRATLDFKNQPRVIVHALQDCPGGGKP